MCRDQILGPEQVQNQNLGPEQVQGPKINPGPEQVQNQSLGPEQVQGPKSWTRTGRRTQKFSVPECFQTRTQNLLKVPKVLANLPVLSERNKAAVCKRLYIFITSVRSLNSFTGTEISTQGESFEISLLQREFGLKNAKQTGSITCEPFCFEFRLRKYEQIYRITVHDHFTWDFRPKSQKTYFKAFVH